MEQKQTKETQIITKLYEIEWRELEIFNRDKKWLKEFCRWLKSHINKEEFDFSNRVSTEKIRDHWVMVTRESLNLKELLKVEKGYHGRYGAPYH